MKFDEEFYEVIECRAGELMPLCARMRGEMRLVQRMKVDGTANYTLFVERTPRAELPVTATTPIEPSPRVEVERIPTVKNPVSFWKKDK